MTADGPSDIEDALKCWVKSPPCCWGTWWKSLPEIYHLWSDAQSVFTVKLHQQSKYLISTWNFPYKVSAWVLEGRCGNLKATFERCYSCRRAFNIQLYLNFIYLSIYFLTYFIYYFVTSHTSYILLTWCHSSLRNVWDCQGTQLTPSGRATGSQVQWGFFPHSGFMLKWWQAFKRSRWSALNQNHEKVEPSYFYTLGWVSLLMHTLFMWKVHLHRVFKPFDGDDDAYYPSIHTSIFFTASLALRVVGILEPVLSSCCLWPQTGLHPGQFASFVEGPLKKTKKHF